MKNFIPIIIAICLFSSCKKDDSEAADIANDTLMMRRAMQLVGSLSYSQGLYVDALTAFKKTAKVCDNMPEKKPEYTNK